MNDDAFKEVEMAADILLALERRTRDIGAKVANGDVSFAAILGIQSGMAIGFATVLDRLNNAVIVMASEQNGGKNGDQ